MKLIYLIKSFAYGIFLMKEYIIFHYRKNEISKIDKYQKKYQRRNKVYDFEEEISCNRFLMHNLGLSF